MFAPRQLNPMRGRLAKLGMVLAVLLVVSALVPQQPGRAALTNSLRDTVPPEVAAGAAVYKSECVVCHGRQGKGDGPVAVSMKPPPANLTDTARMARLSDDSLVQIITHGRGGMPAFKDDLEPEQVRQVVAFIRTLKP